MSLILVKKILVYCLGLLIMAVGVTLSLKANLGISPVNSVPYVISLIAGQSQSVWILIIFTCFTMTQIILLGRDFKKVQLFQVAFSFLYGYFITLSKHFIDVTVPASYILRLSILLVSIVLVAVGLILYLKANLIPLPAEGLVIAIHMRTGFAFHRTKSLFDVAMVTTSISLSIFFIGKLGGIGVGTVVAALFIGRTVGFIEKILLHPLNILEGSLMSK